MPSDESHDGVLVNASTVYNSATGLTLEIETVFDIPRESVTEIKAACEVDGKFSDVKFEELFLPPF